MSSLAFLLLLGRAAHAQPDEAPERTEETATAILSPAAAQLRLQYDWVPDFHGAPGDAHALVFRPHLPFRVFGAQNVARITLPYVLDNPEGVQGVGPVQVLDLVVARTPWGGFGVGALLGLEPLSAESGRASAGPAIGVMARQGRWTVGAFNQNAFGPERSLSTLLPVVGYRIHPALNVSTGNLQIAYDWRRDELLLLPISAQLNFIPVVLGQPIQFEFNPQYNLVDARGTPSWLLTFGIALILPSAPMSAADAADRSGGNPERPR